MAHYPQTSSAQLGVAQLDSASFNVSSAGLVSVGSGGYTEISRMSTTTPTSFLQVISIPNTYDELMIQGLVIVPSASSTPFLQFSSDNFATTLNVDSAVFYGSGALSNMYSTSASIGGAATTARNFRINIYNIGSGVKFYRGVISGNLTAASSTSALCTGCISSSAKINAIRFNFGANSINSGTLILYGT